MQFVFGHPVADAVDSPDGSGAELVTAVQQKWADGFGGNSLNLDKWERLDQTGGAAFTLAVANSTLTVTAPATIGEMWLLSKAIFTIPFDVTAIFRELGTLLATRLVDVDVVEVDPATGAPIANDFLAGDLRNRAGLRTYDATATNWRLAAVGGNSPVESSVSVGSGPSRSANLDATIAYRANDTFLSFAPTDSAAIKNTNAGRLSSQVPSPNGVYKLRLRFRTTAITSGGQWVFSRVLVIDNQEIPVQIMSGAGDQIAGNGIPVNVASMPITSVQGTSGTGLAANHLGVRNSRPQLNADVASAARTASGNSGTIASNGGQTIAGAVKVTAVSGTSPVLDVWLEESFNDGVDWIKVYDVGRFTAAGRIDVPQMLLSGRRRWAWGISGTSPSFTFQIDVMEGSGGNASITRNLIDRTLNPNTGGSTTASINIEGCSRLMAYVRQTVLGSTQAAFAVQVSPDGVNWYQNGNPFTPTSLLWSSQNDRLVAKFARIGVVTAGVAATLGEITLMASE